MTLVRKLGAALSAAALAAGLALLPASPAAAATAPLLSDFRLRTASLPAPSLQDRVNQLDARLPKLGVQNILLQANRAGAWATGSSSACPVQNIFTDSATGAKALPPGRRFCWNPSDANTVGGAYEWVPQGVTTVADAQADELWGSRQAVLVSWYDSNHQSDDNVTKGVRVSFVDANTNQYQHVLLAYPYISSSGGVPTWEAVTTPQSGDHGSLHAGGIVWYGNYLYVADTVQGFRVFDMRYIFDIKAAEEQGLGDTAATSTTGYNPLTGKWSSYGYRYVMPQVDWLVSDLGDYSGKDNDCSATGTPKFSSVSLDRSSGPSLITSEYCANTGGNNPTADEYGRIARWPLDSATGLLKRDSDGKVRATAAYRSPARYIQGATAYNGKFYLSQTGGGENGMAQLLEATPSNGVLSVSKARWAGIGSEDLSVWPSKSEIWTVTEFAGKRVVYTCPLAATADGTSCGGGAKVR
ncbi:hypothetical protein AB0J83_00260 [Actinoplanes sp. NPDC049596]|uniref:hypothetical protein n=1 Tax=unclassified Actinoplanes TaxID=2626549 RepID=UPI003437CA97